MGVEPRCATCCLRHRSNSCIDSHVPAFDHVLATIIARATAEVAEAVRANMADQIAKAMKACSHPVERVARRKPARSARKPAKRTWARRGGRIDIDAGQAAQVLALLEKSPGLRADDIDQRIPGGRPRQ